jgi:hypothetical protein
MALIPILIVCLTPSLTVGLPPCYWQVLSLKE